jgi:hypothetical protein
MKGKTKWFPRKINPVRNGTYECVVLIARCLFNWKLEWDGHGFLVPFPMVVKHWRGQTKKAYMGAKQ